MFSEQYQAVYDAICNTPYKKIFSSEGEEFRKAVLATFRSESPEPDKKYTEKYKISKDTVDKCNCYHYENPDADHTILYIHGGGYFIDLSEMYWSFISELFDLTNTDIYVPQYPITPEYTCEPTYQMLLTLYQDILTKVDPKKVIIMGDSAGGGIALAFAMLLKERNLPQPKEIILISPCLKLSDYSDAEKEEAEELEKNDPMISYKCMETVRRYWGGGRKKEDYIVNPFYGSLEGLADITMFSGTWDILYLYNKEFYNKAKEEGFPIRFYEREKLMHDYVIFPVEESKEDRETIIDTIARKKIESQLLMQ